MTAKTIIRIEITQEEHTQLMLHLLRHDSIITKAINDAVDRGDEIPPTWKKLQTELETLIGAFRHG